MEVNVIECVVEMNVFKDEVITVPEILILDANNAPQVKCGLVQSKSIFGSKLRRVSQVDH